jgi:hypothetical protein
MAFSDIGYWEKGVPYFGDRILAPIKTYNQKFQIINDQVHEIHNIIVHQFTVSDVDDPDLFAAEPLLEWQNSEYGIWIMNHCVETPVWHRHADPATYGYKYRVSAKLLAKDYTFWCLKWQGNVDKYPK